MVDEASPSVVRGLHVFPRRLTPTEQKFLGATKDVAANAEYFASRGFVMQNLLSDEPADKNLLVQLSKLELAPFKFIFMEFPVYPKSIMFLKNHHPHIKVFVRGQNAEFFHKLHYVLARITAQVGRRQIWRDFKDSFRRLYFDVSSAKRADWVFSISDWEMKNYWKAFLRVSNVVTTPFFLSEEMTSFKRGLEFAKKENFCVCATSTTVATLPFTKAAVDGFGSAVDSLGGELSHWRFGIMGNYPEIFLPKSQRLDFLGFQQSPIDILEKCKAMALLSDYGFGFKTKILEAVMAGCYVLLPKKLYRRVPHELQSFCIVVNPRCSGSFKEALLRCETEPISRSNVNGILKERAYRAYDGVFRKMGLSSVE